MRVTYDVEANAAHVELGDVADSTAVENVMIERPGQGDIGPRYRLPNVTHAAWL